MKTPPGWTRRAWAVEAAIGIGALFVMLSLALSARGLTVSEFTRADCHYVAELQPLIDQVKARRPDVEFMLLDVSDPAILAYAKAHGVKVTPTLLADGQLYDGGAAVAYLKSLLDGTT